jgi:hypothetical protein
MNKALAILHMYPNTNPVTDFTVQDDSDGNGPYITHWNLTDPQPTDAELLAAWDSMQPTNADLLALSQARKKKEISDAVGVKIVSGYQSAVVLVSTGKAHFYGTTLVDQQNMTASRVDATANPLKDIKYRPQDALERVVHTHDEFVLVSDGVMSLVSGILDQGYALYTQVYAATTVSGVDAIIVTIT